MFSEFDECSVRGPAAALSVGRLMRAVPGMVPEKLAFADGKPFAASSSGTDNRLWFYEHDRLPWLAAMKDETGTLLGPVTQAAMVDMTVGLGMNERGYFAHKQDASGKINYGGWCGHFANAVESAALLSHVSDRARRVWHNWLHTARSALYSNPNFWTGANRWEPGETRESQWALVMLNLAYEKTRDPFWWQAAEHVADFLLSKPLSEQGLNDPLWVWSLWQVKRERALKWIIDAADWYVDTSWNEERATGLTLLAIHSMACNRRGALGNLKTLRNWADSFYRYPGDPLDWCGQCPGRTGDLVSGQWPIIKAALLQTGLTDADIPKHSDLNFLPLHKPAGSEMAIVKIHGNGISKLDCTFVSQQGDAKGGAVVVNGKRAPGGVMDNVRYGANYGFNQAMIAPTDELEVYSYDAVSVSLPPGAQVIIEAGKVYACPPMRGTLRLSGGKATLSPLTRYLSLHNDRDEPWYGLWAGKDKPVDFVGIKEWRLDIRGPMQHRVALTVDSEAIWEPAR